MVDDILNVGSKVRIKDRNSSGFFFVQLGESDAFGDAATHGLGGLEYGHRPLAVFDDDFSACADMGQKSRNVGCGCLCLGKVNHMLAHTLSIHHVLRAERGRWC